MNILSGMCSAVSNTPSITELGFMRQWCNKRFFSYFKGEWVGGFQQTAVYWAKCLLYCCVPEQVDLVTFFPFSLTALHWYVHIPKILDPNCFPLSLSLILIRLRCEIITSPIIIHMTLRTTDETKGLAMSRLPRVCGSPFLLCSLISHSQTSLGALWWNLFT